MPSDNTFVLELVVPPDDIVNQSPDLRDKVAQARANARKRIREILDQPKMCLFVVTGADTRAAHLVDLLDPMCRGWDLYDVAPRVLWIKTGHPAALQDLVLQLPGGQLPVPRLLLISRSDSLVDAMTDETLSDDETTLKARLFDSFFALLAAP